MARNTLTAKQVIPAGVSVGASDLVQADANGAELLNNDGRIKLTFINSGTAAATATIQTPFQQDGLDLADRAVTIGAAATVVAGPYAPATYNQVGSNSIYIDFTGGTATTKVYAERLSLA